MALSVYLIYCSARRIVAVLKGWRQAMQFRIVLASVAFAALAGCATPATGPVAHGPIGLAATREEAPKPAACPGGLPVGTRCLAGQDSAGAFYLVAVPAHWNGILVLHAHGGPTLGAPKSERSVEDLKRWGVVVKAGYAWAGSTFHQGGVAVHAAAQDTERLRRIFVQHVAQPKLTILHGQSWGASVAAVAASMFTDDGAGHRPYDGVLLSSGVLAGGSHAYDFRLDLRVIYQSLCANHPLPTEPQYPLSIGLPAESQLNSAELRRRVDACLGVDKPEVQRTPEQQRKVKTIVDVVKIPAKSIEGHLAWGTFHFQDVVQRRTGGRSPFGNAGVKYSGSPDDAALNASVARYAADPQAVATFAADTDPDGRIPVPVLTVHGIDDPTAFVEMDDSFRRTMEKAGTADHLAQTFTADNTHSFLSDSAYPTLLAALVEWVRGGAKPTPAQIAERCHQFESGFGANCRFLPDYYPAPLSSRVPPRP
jgi:alpha-beta hydrolase superfamily lysophospholipase